MGKNKDVNMMKKTSKTKDFHKVKFKVGKKLPKNLNETRATFKAKTLILKQQFNLEKSGPVSHRNLSWKELLAHLGHYNQSIKLDALSSLKEMISNNHDLIRLEFASLLENLCPLFTDREYKVREAAIQLFKTFIELPFFRDDNCLALQPFFSSISVYLSCAMTHIMDNIQYSSLKLLDILIEYLPDLVYKNAYTIFDNFIEQISKADLKGNKRVLKNDPYKLSSTQTWRLNVLNRLYKMLQIISNSSGSNSNPTKLNRKKIQFENFHECYFIDEFPQKQLPPSISVCKKTIGKKDLSDFKDFSNNYLKIFTPILIDCWIEARPENKSSYFKV